MNLRRRSTAIYKREPTMFKKAMELHENCGVNVTLVTENKGVFHFYNTGNKTMRQVFEEYLNVLDESPQLFQTQIPVPDEGHGTTADATPVASVDCTESGTLADFLDSSVQTHMKKDALRCKMARKQARKLRRENKENAGKVSSQSSAVAVNEANKPSFLQKDVVKSVEAVRRKKGVALGLLESVCHNKGSENQDKITNSGNTGVANCTDVAEQREKKKKNNRHMHDERFLISPHLLTAVEDAILLHDDGKLSESANTATEQPIAVKKKNKRVAYEDSGGGATKKRTKSSKPPDATDTTLATKVVENTHKIQEYDIHNWFKDVEIGMMMDSPSDQMPIERNDPIFARLARA